MLWMQVAARRESRAVFTALARTNADFLHNAHLPATRQMMDYLGRLLNMRAFLRTGTTLLPEPGEDALRAETQGLVDLAANRGVTPLGHGYEGWPCRSSRDWISCWSGSRNRHFSRSGGLRRWWCWGYSGCCRWGLRGQSHGGWCSRSACWRDGFPTSKATRRGRCRERNAATSWAIWPGLPGGAEPDRRRAGKAPAGGADGPAGADGHQPGSRNP